ncbi:MAG: hypothetical protein FH749_10655 [Firmicutes bacterium]|nr:hypothetical protein [Bacillota bacterium]
MEPLLREVKGSGGFQSLLRRLQQGYNPEANTYTLNSEDIEAIIRYATRYNQGGWQDRLRPLLEEIDVVKNNLVKMIDSF